MALLSPQLASSTLISLPIEIHCFIFIPSSSLLSPSPSHLSDFYGSREKLGSLSLNTKRLPEGVVFARLELWVTEGGDLVSANLAGDIEEILMLVHIFIMESFWGRHSMLVSIPPGFRELDQLHTHSCELKPLRQLHHDSLNLNLS